MIEKTISPVTLEGIHVRLEPLNQEHFDSLCRVGLDENLWLWTTGKVLTPAHMQNYVELALQGQNEGVMLPFVTVNRNTGEVIGSTRYGNIDLHHRRLEIGWTWVAAQWQRTAVNTEAKLLMLRYAFETLACHRVELKTDALNQRSRNAIKRLGAREEGTLRQHMMVDDGRVRDTVYFSIIDKEWPSVEAALLNKLAAY